VLRAQGSAQVRAATAPVQRRKWTLERSRFGADYSGYLGAGAHLNFEGRHYIILLCHFLTHELLWKMFLGVLRAWPVVDD